MSAYRVTFDADGRARFTRPARRRVRPGDVLARRRATVADVRGFGVTTADVGRYRVTVIAPERPAAVRARARVLAPDVIGQGGSWHRAATSRTASRWAPEPEPTARVLDVEQRVHGPAADAARRRARAVDRLLA